MPEILDPFQARYLGHQERKRKLMSGEAKDMPFVEYGQEDLESLIKIMTNRRSRRIYTGKISDEEMRLILRSAQLAPSSCNRKAVVATESKERVDCLVGGKGWIDKADRVILFWADMLAYKSPNERDFMPYLDAGFMAQNVYLMCEVLNIKCCFVNPNGYPEKEGMRFCGAMSIGR